MPQISRNQLFCKLLVIPVLAVLLTLTLYNATAHQIVLACPGPTGVTYPGTEAYASTIALQMPFIAGETWIVGGGGSFYGNNLHCNNPNNDYYATDWNRTNDNGAAVLPVAEGIVSAIQSPCPVQMGYGCYVRIDHANGYRTLYAHLSQVLVVTNTLVHTWTLIGTVGNSGLNGGDPHLHLTFRHFDNGDYYSHCNTATNNGKCPNGEDPQAPQGYRPSPMMTTLGPTVLQDGQAYTSVNGRVYLPDLRNGDTGWNTELFVRNDGTEYRTVKVYYFNADGTATPYGYDTCGLIPNQRCFIPISPNRIPAGATGLGYVDGGEAVSVLATQNRNSPDAWDNYLGVSQPITQVHVPLVHKNNYGLYSEIYIQNSWPTSTNVTVQYTVSPGQLGSSCSETYSNVPARGLKIVRLSNVTCVGATFVGSAYISNSANNLLAVASTQRKSDQSSLAESSYTNGISNTVYGSLIQNNNYTWISGLAIQNASAGTNSLTATYYNQAGGTPCRSDTYLYTSARVSRIASTPFVGCSSVASAGFSGGGQPVSAIVNQVVPGTALSTAYLAVATPSQVVVIPWWRNNFDGWSSGLVVQNVNNQAVNVLITFYDSAGNPSGTPINSQLQPHAIYVTSSTGVTDGSVIITADQPVAAAVNHVQNTSGDRGMSHVGVQR
jgi:murein DD-endopeptidase MepM/ murein hydrolase activator NlpD